MKQLFMLSVLCALSLSASIVLDAGQTRGSAIPGQTRGSAIPGQTRGSAPTTEFAPQLSTVNCQLSINQNPFAYSHYYRDNESGFYYLNSRFYSPRNGIFISRDTYDLPNRHAYGNGDPVMNIDPYGHDVRDWINEHGQTVLEVGLGTIALGALGGLAYKCRGKIAEFGRYLSRCCRKKQTIEDEYVAITPSPSIEHDTDPFAGVPSADRTHGIDIYSVSAPVSPVAPVFVPLQKSHLQQLALGLSEEERRHANIDIARLPVYYTQEQFAKVLEKHNEYPDHVFSIDLSKLPIGRGRRSVLVRTFWDSEGNVTGRDLCLLRFKKDGTPYLYFNSQFSDVTLPILTTNQCTHQSFTATYFEQPDFKDYFPET